MKLFRSHWSLYGSCSCPSYLLPTGRPLLHPRSAFLNPRPALLATLTGPFFAPWLSGCPDFPLVSQVPASCLPPATYFSCQSGSQHTQLFRACDCPRTSGQTTACYQPSRVPLRHHPLVMSEREAACHRPQQPCRRRERPLASKSIGFGIEILGCLSRPTVWRRMGPGAPAGRRVLPPPLSALSHLGLVPPPQSLSFPVARAFTRLSFLSQTPHGLQLSAWPELSTAPA